MEEVRFDERPVFALRLFGSDPHPLSVPSTPLFTLCKQRIGANKAWLPRRRTIKFIGNGDKFFWSGAELAGTVTKSNCEPEREMNRRKPRLRAGNKRRLLCLRHAITRTGTTYWDAQLPIKHGKETWPTVGIISFYWVFERLPSSPFPERGWCRGKVFLRDKMNKKKIMKYNRNGSSWLWELDSALFVDWDAGTSEEVFPKSGSIPSGELSRAQRKWTGFECPS